MLQLSRTFTSRPILSLRTGGKIGKTEGIIVNPDNLKIEGWFASSLVEKGEFIVLSSDIRDIITKGLVVNDHDSMTLPEDLVRLKDIMKIRYELKGKSVVTDSKKKIGKVVDFAADSDSFYIQQLHVMPSLFKSLNGRELIVGRNQVIEVQSRKIIVVEPTATVRSRAISPAPAEA